MVKNAVSGKIRSSSEVVFLGQEGKFSLRKPSSALDSQFIGTSPVRPSQASGSVLAGVQSKRKITAREVRGSQKVRSRQFVVPLLSV